MSDERIEEAIPPEETPESTPDTPEADEGQKDWKAEVERLQAEKQKAEEVAENYKREAQKYRDQEKAERLAFQEEKKGETTSLREDYLSKRQDVMDEVKEDIKSLDESEWDHIRHLVNPALEGVFTTASKQSRFVAKGEIHRAISDLIIYAKSTKTQKEDLEKARAEGALSQGKKQQAEISGVKRGRSSNFSDEVQQLAEEKGWDAETAKTILENRKQREKEYAPSRKY